MKIRVPALVVVSTIALTLTACFPTRVPLPQPEQPEAASPAAEAPASREELEVVEIAFGREERDATIWWYVVILENPNRDFVFSNVAVDVEALDPSGVILDTDSHYATLLSGRYAFTGTFYGAGTSDIAELSVRGPQATSAIHSPADETGSYAFEEVTAVSDSYSTTVSGIISGTFAEEQSLVMVNAVVRDATGTIIYGGFTYVDRLPVDGKARFEVSFFDVLPADATYEVYATP